MTEVASKEQVEKFLAKVADCIQKDHFFIVNRSANLSTAADLEISLAAVVDIVRNLTFTDYFRGPRSGIENDFETVCEFGSVIGVTEVYIKLVQIERYGYKMCKCVSFHPPKEPIVYPLREGSENGEA